MPPSRLATLTQPHNLARASRRLITTRHLKPTARFSSTQSQPHSSVPSSGQNHNDLTSFLTHVRTANLSQTSTTYLGTYYEYLTLHTLTRYGLRLARVGGRGDQGVDLKGHWHLPPGLLMGNTDNQLDVVVQCKRLKEKVGPGVVRELEGVVARESWRNRIRGGGGAGVLGILVGQTPATKGVREAMGRSGMGLGWVMLTADADNAREDLEGDNGEDGEGQVRQFLWNNAAARMGLGGVDVVTEFGGKGKKEGRGMEGEVVLMWKGQRIGSHTSE